MSSNEQPSTSASLVAGPSLSKGMKARCKTRVRPNQKEDSNPKHSAATEMKFRVMRQCLERLMREGTEIKEIRRLLQQAVRDVEKEMEVLSNMRTLAKKCWEFQTQSGIGGQEEEVQSLL